MRLNDAEHLKNRLEAHGYGASSFPGFYSCIDDMPTMGFGEAPAWIEFDDGSMPEYNTEVLIKTNADEQRVAIRLQYGNWLVKAITHWEGLSKNSVGKWRPLPQN